VVNESPAFNEVMEGEAPMVQFIVNETQYNMGYLLTLWQVYQFVKVILNGKTECQVYRKVEQDARDKKTNTWS